MASLESWTVTRCPLVMGILTITIVLHGNILQETASLVVDITNSYRYYNPADFRAHDVGYVMLLLLLPTSTLLSDWSL